MPDPLIVTGKSRVFPLDVIVPVLANVTVLAPAVTVIPVDNVSPARESVTLLQLPEDPVKSKSPMLLEPENVTMLEPAAIDTLLLVVILNVLVKLVVVFVLLEIKVNPAVYVTLLPVDVTIVVFVAQT